MRTVFRVKIFKTKTTVFRRRVKKLREIKNLPARSILHYTRNLDAFQNTVKSNKYSPNLECFDFFTARNFKKILHSERLLLF